MNYDFSISENVSLSRILDQLINDNEKPEVIINFLKLHDDDFKDIIVKSFCWKRIFQLDFIFECNDACIDYIVSKLACISNQVAMYLVWQVCKNETELPKYIKDKVRTYAFIHLNGYDRNFSSPYSSMDGKIVEHHYDAEFFDACNKKCLIDAMCGMPDDKLHDYCNSLEYSLFKHRFLQYDVFSCLSDIQKFIVLRKVTNAGTYLHHTNRFDSSDFIVQVLESDERPEVKIEAVAYWNQFDLKYIGDDPNDYANCGSFSELLIRMSIDGTYDCHSVIQHLLDYNRIDILKDWIEYDEAGFNEAYNIGDLVKYMTKPKDKKAA